MGASSAEERKNLHEEDHSITDQRSCRRIIQMEAPSHRRFQRKAGCPPCLQCDMLSRLWRMWTLARFQNRAFLFNRSIRAHLTYI